MVFGCVFQVGKWLFRAVDLCPVCKVFWVRWFENRFFPGKKAIMESADFYMNDNKKGPKTRAFK